MIKFNRATMRDKVYACWLGKNIGGTIGGPFEGKTAMNDVQGFVTKPGEVLPNDDLDLQLLWLRVMEERGPRGITPQVLGEYWLSFIGPNWNEYGVAKGNLRAGIPAPMSGAVNNAHWDNSNGAWIRTEIWACLYPGKVEEAIRYAFYDASVDHGYGEGSYAAIFVAAMESAAFIFNDINLLIDIGLSKIPSDCRVARSVNIAREAYRSGKTWQEARQLLVEDSADLGWFQAPANVGFVIIGLLYGEGDFKKAMLRAVNCGDDTDCTAATVGSIMGIIGGTAGLPEDWVAYMGEEIVQKCLVFGHGPYPTSITQLTDAVMNAQNVTLNTPFFSAFNDYRFSVLIHDEADDFSELVLEDYYGTQFVDRNFTGSEFTVSASSTFTELTVAFDRKPTIEANGTLTGTVTIFPRVSIDFEHCELNWYLPEGWSVSGEKNLFHFRHHNHTGERALGHHKVAFTITAGANVAASNHIVLEGRLPGRSESVLIAFDILG